MGFFKNIYLKHRIQWYCDNCEAHLNKQDNFSVKTGRWECTKCSYNNDVSLEYVGKGNKLEQDKEKKQAKYCVQV